MTRINTNSIIPISRFNKGEASRIFKEVSSEGVKVVVKNNVPMCVLMDPEEYEKISKLLGRYTIK